MGAADAKPGGRTIDGSQGDLRRAKSTKAGASSGGGITARSIVFVPVPLQSLDEQFLNRDAHFLSVILHRITGEPVSVFLWIAGDAGYSQRSSGISMRLFTHRSRLSLLVRVIMKAIRSPKPVLVLGYFPTLGTLLTLVLLKLVFGAITVMKSDSSYDFLEQNHRRSLPPFKRRLLGALLGFTDLVLVETEMARSRLQQLVRGRAVNVEVVPNGAKFTWKEVEEASRGVKKEKRVLYVGRVDDPGKGVELLIQAFCRVAPPDWTLRLAGRCNDRWRQEVLRRLGTANADRIVFLGHIYDRSVLLDEYLRATVFVLPSWQEGFNLSILEAALAGCLIIATAVGGNCDVLEGGRLGFIVEPGNLEQLQSALGKVMANPGLFRPMAEGLQEKARFKYTWEAVEQEVGVAIRRVLDHLRD